MGKKKPFIDKKTASVYHVVRRSQRDVGTEATAETLSDFVLMPSPDNAVKDEARRQRQQLQQEGPNQEPKQESKQEPNQEPKQEEESNENLAASSNTFSEMKNQIAKAGLADQTAATYSRYTKPITGSGMYIPNNAHHHAATKHGVIHDDETNLLLTDPSKNELDTALQEAMAVHEVGRMLDSIALTPDCMEEDVARALFEDYEEGEYEEILDDFCITASMEPAKEPAIEDGNDGDLFDYDSHIRKLMERANAKEAVDGMGTIMEDNFFSGKVPLHQQNHAEEDSLDREFDNYGEYEEYDETDRLIAATNNNSQDQKALTQKFENALLEYDSDDVGDLDNECEDIVGSRPLEGDVQLEAALDEFLTDKRDEVLVEGTAANPNHKKKSGGSGYSVLVGKTMVNASDVLPDASLSPDTLAINMEETKRQLQRDMADADAILANPEMDLPPEEVLIDGKSYFSETSRNPWDCESILSTYSNLDNNPVVIGRSSRRKKKKKKDAQDDASQGIPEGAPVQIQLSNKTGLPLGVLPHKQSPTWDAYEGDDTFVSINRGEARNKTETHDEKKVRKMAIKEERKICRMQKKIMKEAFREEFQKRGEVVDAVGGTTVFRYS